MENKKEQTKKPRIFSASQMENNRQKSRLWMLNNPEKKKMYNQKYKQSEAYKKSIDLSKRIREFSKKERRIDTILRVVSELKEEYKLLTGSELLPNENINDHLIQQQEDREL